MQIANTSGREFPSSQGSNSAEIAVQLRRYRRYHKRTQLRRNIRFWWLRLLAIGLAGFLAAVLGPSALIIWKILIGGAAGLLLVFLAIRRIEFGLLLIVVLSTAFFPVAFSLKSLNVYPTIIMLPFVFSAAMIQVAFRVRKAAFPSFWVSWPLWGLIVLAIVSNLMVQVTWTHTVPHKVINNPVIYDEILGVGLFCIPLMLILTTTIALAGKEQWIEYIQRGLLVLALMGAAIVTFEFRRIGGDVYTFRYTEPKILWMSLRGLATLLALGTMIAYVRFLYAEATRQRLIYGAMTVWFVASVYFTLENSWWLEVGVGLLVITLVYSRRLLLTLGVFVLPLIPLIKAELAKLAQYKTVDNLRFVIWQDALRVWSKQPVLGVGPGNFWAYDQRFTHLPVLLANFEKTGLGVAHNGYLQALGELGPLGLLLQLSLISVIVLASLRLLRRSKAKLEKRLSTRRLERGLAKIGLDLYHRSESRRDAMLGLVALGLIFGSAVADFTSGFFFLPPRQLGGFNDLPQVMAAWVIWGCVLYKDQLWRRSVRERGLNTSTEEPELEPTGLNRPGIEARRTIG